MKVLNILAAVCAAVGVPWAALVWLAGAMKSVPGLDVHDLATCLPLPILAALFGIVSVLLSRYSVPPQPISKWAVTAVVLSLIIAGIVVSTYFDMKQPRFLK
jgi:hypothetical protein